MAWAPFSARATPEEAVHYASFWITALLAALTALKLGRTLPVWGILGLWIIRC